MYYPFHLVKLIFEGNFLSGDIYKYFYSGPVQDRSISCGQASIVGLRHSVSFMKDQHTFTWSGITSDHNTAGTLFKYLQKQCSDNMAVVCSLTDPSYGIRLLLLQKAKTVSLTRLMILLSPPDITLTLLAPHQGSIIKTNFFLRLSRVIASYFLSSKCIV